MTSNQTGCTMYANTDNESVVVQCYCGIGQDHGQLELMVNRGKAEDDPDIRWFDAAGSWVRFYAAPVYGHKRPYWLHNLIARLRVCKKIVKGQRQCLDFFISPTTCRDLAAWLVWAADESVTVQKALEPHTTWAKRERSNDDVGTRPGASTTAGSVPQNPSEPVPGLSKEDV